MKKAFVISWLLLLLALFPAACSPTSQWKDFKSEKGNFSVRMPAELELAETTQSVPTGSGNLEIYSFDGNLGDAHYSVFYYDTLEGMVTGPNTWDTALDGARNGWLQFINGRLQAETQLTLGDYPGREALVQAKNDGGQDITIQARYYLVRNRLYQVAVSGPKDREFGPQMVAFLNSFALLTDETSGPIVTPTVGPDHTGAAGIGPLPKKGFLGIRTRNIVNTGGGFVRIGVDPVSHEIYYMDGLVNIYRLMIKPGASSTGWKVYSAEDVGVLSSSLGMTFGPDGSLYVLGNEPAGDTTRAIIRKGTPDASGKRAWSTLVSTQAYPLSKNQFDHVYNGLAVSPDGKTLFIAGGSRTDHGEVETGEGAFPDTRELPITSAIFRVPTDSSDLVLPNDEAGLKPYLFADGLRNAFDLAFNAQEELFAIDNGPDADFPDELNWVQEGYHYGFPWRFGNEDNPQQFPGYNPAKDAHIQGDFLTYHNDPGFPPAPTQFTDPVANLGPDAASFRDEQGRVANAVTLGQPLYSFTPHRSPLGLVFDTQGILPGTFKGHAFLLSWGASLSSFQDKGQDLLDLALTKQGDTYQMTATQIMTGFKNPIDAVLFDNKLYVLEYGGKGGIWEITFP